MNPQFPDEAVTVFAPGADSGTYDFFNEEVLGEGPDGEVIRVARPAVTQVAAAVAHAHGAAHAAHLVQDDRHAGRGDLPSGFAAGEAAADDMDGQG